MSKALWRLGISAFTIFIIIIFFAPPISAEDEETFSAIDLISPNGGEVFFDNEKIRLIVNQKNIKRVFVDFWFNDFNMRHESYSADPAATTGIYEQQLPQGNCVMPDVKVKIKISGESSHPRGTSAGDESDGYVTIKSSPDRPIKPSLQLLTPNGGETFHPGDTITVSWLQNNINRVTAYLLPDSLKDELSFKPSRDGIRIDPYPTPSDPSNFQWKIPDTISDGKYRIWIGGMSNNCSYARYAGYDWSDILFQIEIKKELPPVIEPKVEPKKVEPKIESIVKPAVNKPIIKLPPPTQWKQPEKTKELFESSKTTNKSKNPKNSGSCIRQIRQEALSEKKLELTAVRQQYRTKLKIAKSKKRKKLFRKMLKKEERKILTAYRKSIKTSKSSCTSVLKHNAVAKNRVY